MSPLPSTIVSIVFLFVGIITMYTMMSVQGRSVEHPKKYITVHKATGYIFAVLFLFMFVTMLWRIEDYWQESSPRTALHVFLAVALFFLLTIKILIPRFFKRLNSHLFALGITLYAMGFTLVTITAGYYLIWKSEHKPYVVHVDGRMMDTELGKQLFITKCSTCHMLSDIMRPRGIEDWEDIINRMILLAAPRITVDEGNQILHYLSQTHVPKPVSKTAKADPVERHCLPCHKSKDIYRREHTRAEWKVIVRQMHAYDPDIVPEKEFEKIISFLLKEEETGTEK
jgi:hypothetical protein